MDPHILLSLFHIFVVVPFFLYVALNRGNIPHWIFTATLALGVFILIYHGYKAWIRIQVQSPSLWINLLHVFLVAPLLIYVGANEKNTPRPAYELLAIAGFGALGYHLYSLVLSINSIQDFTQ
jgi:hypothetical protein